MCWNKRAVYTCGHFEWGIQVKACDIETAFISGTSNIACDSHWSHPLHAVKVGKTCSECNLKRIRLSAKMTKTKLLMKEMNEILQRHRPAPIHYETETSPAGTDEAVEEAMTEEE